MTDTLGGGGYFVTPFKSLILYFIQFFVEHKASVNLFATFDTFHEIFHQHLSLAVFYMYG